MPGMYKAELRRKKPSRTAVNTLITYIYKEKDINNLWITREKKK